MYLGAEIDIRVKLIAKSRASAMINVSYAEIMVWLHVTLTGVTVFVRLWDWAIPKTQFKLQERLQATLILIERATTQVYTARRRDQPMPMAGVMCHTNSEATLKLPVTQPRWDMRAARRKGEACLTILNTTYS